MKSMKMRLACLVPTILVAAVPALPAQGNGATKPELTGTWEASTPDGLQTVVVHADSTASFGEETVRWRTSQDTIFIQFGDEWVGYNFALTGNTLTLSGGDLEEPIALRRVAPPPDREEANARSASASP